MELDEEDPEGYRGRMNRFGRAFGASRIGGSVYDVPPGQSICPYHYEYPEEEWALVLEGVVTVRTPAGEDEVRSGEVVCFPAGPEGAHKLTNRTESEARVLMISTVNDPAVVVYPDSDKIAFFSGNDRDHGLLRRESADVDYWDGEK